MGDLSPHFSRKEFECRCCGRLVLDDNLLDGLEALRKLAGVPVVVNAGYRCRQHNQEVGGVPNSEHTRGWRPTFACPDCPCRGCTNWRWRSPNSHGDGDLLHVDVRDHRARWARVDGKYVGIEQLLREPQLLAEKSNETHVG